MLPDGSATFNVARRRMMRLGAAVGCGAGLALLLAALGGAGEPPALAAPLASPDPALIAVSPAQAYNDLPLSIVDEPPPGLTPTVYLPLVMSQNAPGCGDYLDDFSSPASGWWAGNDGWVWASYFEGEYRVVSEMAGYVYGFTAPTCRRENYIVEADARWAGASGNNYGLEFGINANDQYYVFFVSADYGDFALFRRDSGAWVTLANWTLSDAVNRGGASNHLKATRNGTEIRLDLNGVYLGTWTDDAIAGPTLAGLFSSPRVDMPSSDARFDNYRITTLPGETSPGMRPQSGPAALGGGQGAAMGRDRDPAPPRGRP